ncbi:S-layer homology domain-containing protein [Paenibacillus sp. CF384]|uniref:S-layer homology domain-containing protein n=1 Tax=Paenibacillus sp. CF384 TaxID=1884382 RepID=UPI00089CE91D|nr:S-layer homology domain-containing protein [Paenibacillus sp. CF384]SDY02164.1 S-layer homology domain-containing protein [Paenibacillus sp. CF384]
MRKHQPIVRLGALLLAIFLTIPFFQASPAAADPVSPSAISHYDYFSDVYPNLQDAHHVFRTATYEDIAHLFESEGTYAVLFGGASVASTQANIGFLNQVAKEYNVSTIYNFDTKLDGVSLDLADSSNQFAGVYTDLVNKYLTKKDASGTAIEASPAADVKDQTLLFIYNKDNKDGANSQPIVASLKSSNTASDFLTDGKEDAAKVTAYKDQVRAVFGAAPSYDTINPNDFIELAFNKNVKFNSTIGRDIFDGTDGNVVLEHVTYHELTKLLAAQGNYAILFGGSWCPNTQAAIKFINEYAKKYNVDKVYMWDPRLDAGVDVTQTDSPTFDSHDIDRLMVRDTNHPYANLYVDLVNTYLTNIKTQYVKGTTDVRYTDANSNVVIANKLQVPYLFTYNKDNKDAAGNSSPILGHVELMYSWTNIQPDYVPNGVLPNTVYKAALDKLFSRLEAVPTGLAGVKPTTANGNDGQITGTKAGLEYKLAGAASYTAVTGNSITGLAAGTYNVRYAAKPGYNGPVSKRVEGVSTLIAPVEVLYNPGASVDVIVPAGTGSGSTAPQTPYVASTPTVDVKNTTTGNTVTSSFTVPSKTDAATGTTSAVVTKEVVTALVADAKKAETTGKSAVIEFKVEASAATETGQLSIPRSAFNEVADGTGAQVKVNYTAVGSIVFDAKAADNIRATSGDGDIKIEIAKRELTEEGKQVLGDRPVYELTVKAGDQTVSTFGGGSVKVSVPYTLKADEDPSAVIVYYLTDDGYLETVNGNFNAATGTVDFVTNHFSQYIVGYNKVAFSDVAPASWYSKAVTFLAARDIAAGTDENHYSPLANVTRGQFLVLLLKAYGIVPNETEADNFADAGNTYYSNYLGAAKRLGITNGLGDNVFAPDKVITRQDLFTLLYRSLDALGKLPTAKSGASVSSFTDANQIAAYAQEAAAALVEGGVVSGNNGKLSPKGVTTRAEVAQVLYNLLANE